MTHKQTVAVDFDGVIHSYEKGWQDGSIYGTPVEGAFEHICKIRSRGYNVVIFSARPKEQIGEWLLNNWPRVPPYGDIPEVVNEKPLAVAYIDDRAIRFQSWKQTWDVLSILVFRK